MGKYWSLTKVLMRDLGSVFEISTGKNKKSLAIFVTVSLVFAFLSIAFMLFGMILGIYEVFQPLGQLPLATALLLNMVCVIIFVFSAFSTPAIFYFTKEVEYLLPLPLSPVQIIAAKFTIALLVEYIVCLFVLGPMFAVYIQHLPAVTLGVHMLLSFLTLPILPLAYSVIIVMILMRLSSLGRNRERYTMFVGLIGVFLGFAIGIFSQRLARIEPQQLMDLMNGNQGVLLTLRSLFPNTTMMSYAIAESDWAAQALSLLITAGVLLVFFALAQGLYFRGVVGISESSSPAKKMSRGELQRAAKTQNPLVSYLIKELKLLFRSPTAFLNCVLMVFLMPVLLVVMLLMNGDDSGINILSMFSLDFADPQTVTYIFVGAAAGGFLLASMNLVTATSISREGRNYFIMKYIPVSYRVQLGAKVASGVVVGLMGLLVTVIALEVLFKAPPLVFLGVFLLALPGSVILNMLGLLIDLMRPVLLWDNEQHAVKQNLNVLFLMLVGIVLMVLVLLVGLLFLKTPITAFWILFLLETGLAVAAFFFVANVSEDLIKNLSV